VIYDGSCLVADRGRLIAESERFSFEEVQLLSATVELGSSRPAAAVLDLQWQIPQSPQALTVTDLAGLDYNREDEFVLAETLGLFDYLRKSYSRGFVLSLSGGVDSATCAALIYAMVQRAVAELGLEGFKKRLSYFEAIQGCGSIEELMPHMLCCVYQATANSGSVTQKAAESLAREIFAEYHFFDVDPLLRGYMDLVQGTREKALSWEENDLALQNIQARVRAPGVWMMANLRGGLLLTTSNRSEAAVGYATMDGDTSGGLCPLGGVDKTFLRTWLKHFEVTAQFACGPLPSLRLVNEQEPTAELRPPGSEQKDEEDLMPYEVLDFVEKLSIRDKKSPREIFWAMQEEFGRETQLLYSWLHKFYSLWSRNQWKRERYAPAFHMDDENLDPKTWCRFPILSGAYKREMTRLRAEIGLEDLGTS
jgi:NAD+ synthase (glutamine-hydrolysing)